MKRFLSAVLGAFAIISFATLVSAEQNADNSSPPKKGATEGKSGATAATGRPLVTGKLAVCPQSERSISLPNRDCFYAFRILMRLYV
jgi:hypothetical protein